MGGVAAMVRSGAWRSLDIPDRVAVVPTMLSPDETRLLYALARESEGRGRVVDAGCFLGGSTVALAQGLRDGGQGQIIHVYDRFTAERYTLAEHWFDGTDVTRRGNSFRHLFDENLAGFAGRLVVHEGDIGRAHFDAPIELLFLDVLKKWRLSDTVTARSFRRLVPGAVVIQQDWGSGTLPWVTLTMERLAPWFDLLCDVGPSRVYELQESIPSEALAVRWSDMDPAWMVTTYEQVVDSLDGTAQGLQQVNFAWLLAVTDGVRAALAKLTEAERIHGSDPIVMAAVANLRGQMPAWAVPVSAVWSAGYRRWHRVRGRRRAGRGHWATR